MKETPPVLTAGPAAWIRDRAGKRSRLLGTRPSRAAGGQATARAEPTHGAPLSRSALPELGQGGERVVFPATATPAASEAWCAQKARGGLAVAEARAQHPAAGWRDLGPEPGARAA